jgi:hypothetical protein
LIEGLGDVVLRGPATMCMFPVVGVDTLAERRYFGEGPPATVARTILCSTLIR